MVSRKIFKKIFILMGAILLSCQILLMNTVTAETTEIIEEIPYTYVDKIEYEVENNIIWLARAISAEAKGEPIEGQIAVANVILNRVQSSDYPDTIVGVIFQDGQFDCVRNKSIFEQPTAEAITSAKMALDGTKVVDEKVLFYYNPDKVKRTWLKTRKVVTKIGRHLFLY